MKGIEKSGKSVDEAIATALEELNLTRDQVNVEILEEPKAGFLGLATHPAIVRVTPRGEESAETSAEEVSEIKTESDTEDISDKAESARALLQQILDQMKIQATVSVKSTADDQIDLSMEGEDVGILIGKHGQTINALQYLMGVIINRKAEKHMRVILDAEDYRERRASLLQEMARNMAETVKQRKEEAVFEPLPAIERRVIHMALKDDPEIRTYSEGVEPERCVVISPVIDQKE